MVFAPRKGSKSSFFLLAAFCCFSLANTTLNAQGVNVWNPSERSLPWVTEINPAIVSFQNSQISLGLKVFHWGFLEGQSLGLRENRINLSLPFLLPNRIGLGFDLRYYSASIYSEIASSLLLSREIFNRFAIGAKFAFEHRGFNQDNFHIVDAGDPLLADGVSVSNFNLGFGAYWKPGRFTLGLGYDHLNTPDIGKLSQAIVPRELAAAIGYQIGPIIPTIVIHDDGKRWRFGTMISVVKLDVGAIRLAYESTMPFKVEASFNLTKISSLQYDVDLPTEGTRGVSAGTQELVYTHILGGEPEIGQPEILFSTRELQILHERVIRNVPADLRVADLTVNNELAPEYLDASGHAQEMLVLLAGSLSQYETESGQLERYRRLRTKILPLLQQNSRLQVVLRADAQTTADAERLKTAILHNTPIDPGRIRITQANADSGRIDFTGFEPGKITSQQRNPVYSADRLVISLPVKSRTRRTNSWEITITDMAGNAVRRFVGDGLLPGSIVWDWQNAQGEPVAPGNYVCHVAIQTTGGKNLEVISVPVKVLHIRRTVRLKFQRDPEMQTSKRVTPSATVGEL